MAAASGQGAKIDMTTWALINTTDGTITGHGDSDPVAAGATVVTADQYATIAAAAEDGLQCRMISGVVRLLPAPTPAVTDLAQIKTAAELQVDLAAEVARSRFLTAGSGQALEYQATKEDADRALAVLAATPGATLDAADYPWLEAERLALAAIGVTVTLAEVAALVKTTMDAWKTAGSAIKQVRRTAKLEIEAASSADAVAAIVTNLVWPAPPA
jgi:hypothetical protein